MGYVRSFDIDSYFSQMIMDVTREMCRAQGMTIVYLSSVFIIKIKSSISLSKTAIFVLVKSEEMRYTSY